MMLPSSTVELVFPPSLMARPAPWNAPPGAALASESMGLALHFAPARWLLLDTPQVAVAAAANGASSNSMGHTPRKHCRRRLACRLFSMGVTVPHCRCSIAQR
jgi:hypothetical protein